jgi:hypothetical protein
LAHDKLKAIRLLGRHPIDALDFEDVARIYLASHVLLNQGGEPFQEILNELSPEEGQRFESYLKMRPYNALAPKDAVAARQMLLEIVDRAVDELEDKAGVYRELTKVHLETAGRRLSWDDTPEGERLRRYEMACSRMEFRVFDLLMKVRRTGSELDIATIDSISRSVPTVMMESIDQPEPTVADLIIPPDEPIEQADPPNEANLESENAPNEAKSHVQAPSSEQRDGHKEFRIDTPHVERKSAGMGIGRKDRGGRALPELDFGRRSPLLNLAPIFGKQ